MLERQMDRATQGKKRYIKTVRDRKFGKELISLRTEQTIPLKICYAMLNIVFRIVLLSLGVQAIIIQILSCSALRAMTNHESKSAVILFAIFFQLLIFYGAILYFICSP